MRTVATAEAALTMLLAGEVDCAEVPLVALFDGTLGDRYEALPVFPNRASPAYSVFGTHQVPGFTDLEIPGSGQRRRATMGLWVQVLTGAPVDLASLGTGSAVDAIQRKDTDFIVLPPALKLSRSGGGVRRADGTGDAGPDQRASILSVVVVSRKLTETRRWLPVSLTDAFVEVQRPGHAST